jgi:hypothetical protein
MYRQIVSTPAWYPELDELVTFETVRPIAPAGLVVVTYVIIVVSVWFCPIVWVPLTEFAVKMAYWRIPQYTVFDVGVPS